MPSSDVDAAFIKPVLFADGGHWRRAGFHWDDAGEFGPKLPASGPRCAFDGDEIGAYGIRWVSLIGVRC